MEQADRQETQEPSLLTYARFYGLAKDHLRLDPLSIVNVPEFDNTDLFPLPVETSPYKVVQHEKLSADKNVAALLGSIVRPPPPSPELSSADYKRIKRIKVESPVLRGTDHELDMRDFQCRRRAGQNLERLRMNIPFERIEEGSGEGLGWSLMESELPGVFWGKAMGEKLVAPKEAAVLLQDVLRGLAREEGKEGEEEDEMVRENKKNKSWEPITPPLLPLTPPVGPFVPSSSVGHLDPLSERASPTADELRAIEEHLMKGDAMTCSKILGTAEFEPPVSQRLPELEDIHSSLRSMGESSSSPIRNPLPAYRLKVEGPLTPPNVIVPPNKTVLLKDIIDDIPTPIGDPEDQISSEAELAAFYEGTIKPIADKANREVEQEQLQEADATKRVDVPLMDFSLPTPPWKTYLKAETGRYHDSGDDLSKQMRLVEDIASIHLQNSYWMGAKRVERELRWTPFPLEMGRVVTTEIMDDGEEEGKVEEFVAGSNSKDEIDSGSLIWKPDGLRILKSLKDEDDEDDELQPGIFRDGKDMRSLVTKRKLQLEEGEDIEGRKVKEGAGPARRGIDNLDAQPLLGNVFSATKALKSFMIIRGHDPKRMKLMHSPHFAYGASNECEREVEPKPTEVVESSSNPPAQSKIPLPTPAITPPKTPRSFVVSSTFLSQRRLSRRVEQLFPTAELIERDFGPEPTNTRQASGSMPMYRTDIPSEADIILSPSTGLIWTTLQKIKQRPLPGQQNGSQNSVRERIQRIHVRYEQLIVLVSEATESDSRDLDESDCTALTELMGFAASLGENAVVEIRYIPWGDEELAKWIVGYMIRYAIPEDLDVKLLQEETSWELFLRRAGLNAYAAQVVLRELKPSRRNGQASSMTDLDSGDVYGCDHGLSAFVELSVEERVRKFEGLLGGRRLLIRASEAVDERWQ